MNTLKIEKEVTKEDVYVFTQCEKDFQKVAEIITRSGESLIGKDDYFVTYSPLNGYWVTLDSIGDKHQITIPQLAELLGVEYPLKSKFKKGVWYRVEDGSLYAIIRFSGELVGGNYGINFSGDWTDVFNMVLWDGQTYKEATASEVERALIAEAKRRYKAGDEVTQVNTYNSGSVSEPVWVYKGVEDWTYNGTSLFNENLCLMHEGVWAEVIEQKQLPTLEELIAEAKSKIEVISREYPCWVEGMRVVKTLVIDGNPYPTEKDAIVGYISKKLREDYL